MENEIVKMIIVVVCLAYCAYRIVSINRRLKKNRQYVEAMSRRDRMDRKKVDEIISQITEKKCLVVELKDATTTVVAQIIYVDARQGYLWYHCIRRLKKLMTREELMSWVGGINPDVANFKIEEIK
jgi:hypothetical protein